MADEYTPVTREIGSAYVCDSLGAGIDEAEARRRFSRWLTAHDRETAACAWDEGYQQGRSDQADHSMYHQTHTANPHREGGADRG